MDMLVFNSGDVIVREGAPGTCMFYVLAGKVAVYLHYAEDDERKLGELEEKQFFGEMGLLNGKPRSATVVALEDNTCVQVITKENFKAFCAEYPEEVFVIMQQLSERLRTANLSEETN